MVSRPVIAANISSPALFRAISEARPTLLIDEADTFLAGNDEMRGILNSGYERATAYVVRVGVMEPRPGAGAPPANNSRLERFSCWCPKVMASIGRLPDTLSDRCITIRMQRKTPGEQCARLRDYRDDGLRSRCARFVMDNAEAIRAATPGIPTDLNDRAADIWEPLIVLADLAGGRWPAAARDASLAFTTITEQQTPIRALLMDIFITFTLEQRDRFFTRDLLQHLETFGDRPYKELTRGKPLTSMSLSSMLRPYGVESRTIWIDSHTSRGYRIEDFSQAFQRYMSKKDIEEFLASHRPPPAAQQAA
jgi:hypothetical protein